MGNKPKLTKDDFLCEFNDANLTLVITLSEAMYMWDISRRSLERYLYTGELSCRKTFTGGTILVTMQSMLRVYGKPKNAKIYEYYKPKYKENE